MKVEVGNIWDYPADVICIPTCGVLDSSGNLVMGAGVALQAKTIHYQLPQIFGDHVSKYGNTPTYTRVSTTQPKVIVSFPTKYHWKDPSNINLIENSARCIQAHFSIHSSKIVPPRIVLPPVGCGLGGLKWKDVYEVINPILDDKFLVLLPAESWMLR